MGTIDGGRRLRDRIALIAYNGNRIIAQIHEQFLWLLFRCNEPAAFNGTRS
jgi:hypothetical protein